MRTFVQSAILKLCKYLQGKVTRAKDTRSVQNAIQIHLLNMAAMHPPILSAFRVLIRLAHLLEEPMMVILRFIHVLFVQMALEVSPFEKAAHQGTG
jgi:hypothetical protein